MELDSRKNEGRAEFKQQDIRIEVRFAAKVSCHRLTFNLHSVGGSE